MNLSRFDGSNHSTSLWFRLCVVIPANAFFHVWLYRGIKSYDPNQMPDPWRSVLRLPTIVGVYGLELLSESATFGEFWPWTIADFHGGMYLVAYLTPALGAILLWRAVAAIEVLTLGLTMTIGGLVPVVGLATIGIQNDNVDWAQLGTCLWIGSLTVLFVIGLGLTLRSLVMRRS